MKPLHIASCLIVSIGLVAGNAVAQGECSPPSYTGPDGPRPADPTPNSGSGSDSTSRGATTGDTGRPTGPTDTTRGPGGARTPASGPRGAALTFTRGKSSKKRLSIHWEYPKPNGEDSLDFETALTEIRGNDPRPLLVLREGSQYGKSYDVMLRRKLGTDKTTLLTQWFHCVRFSTEIMKESHPYHSLFGGEFPPQFFAVSWDGRKSIPMSGVHSLGYLQRSMIEVLKVEYRKDPSKAVTQWFRVLSNFDDLDQRESVLRKQMDDTEFKYGPKTRRLKPLQNRMAKLAKRRSRLLKTEAAILDLGLIRKTPAARNSRLLERIRGTR